jgi:uncharacterized protein DUF4129
VNRAVRAGTVALGLGGLLLVVALAARGGHPGSDGHVTTRAVPASLQDSLVTLLAIVYVVAIVAVIVLFFRRQPVQMPPESRWLRNFVMVMALMLLATALGYWVVTHTHFHRHNAGQQQPVVGAPQRPSGAGGVTPASVRSAKFEWPLAAGLGGLVVLGGVAILVLRRREPLPADAQETVETALVRAVDLTIEDLRREADPRRAVVAAYASMERALGAHGLPRRPADAPLEYLARILRELEVRESAVSTLTRLFEYARFSPHEIGAGMKEEALGALVAVRADLLAEESAAA